MSVINRIKGFTMIEVIIVLAIIAILALLTVPQFEEGTRKARFNSLVDQFYADLNLARRSAINLNTYIQIDIGSSSYIITDLKDNLDSSDDDEVILSRRFNSSGAASPIGDSIYGSGWSIVSSDYGSSIRFSPNGTAIDDSGDNLGGAVTITGPGSLSKSFQIYQDTGYIQ